MEWVARLAAAGGASSEEDIEPVMCQKRGQMPSGLVNNFAFGIGQDPAKQGAGRLKFFPGVPIAI